MDPSNPNNVFENPRSAKGCLLIAVVSIVSLVGTFLLADVLLDMIGM